MLQIIQSTHSELEFNMKFDDYRIGEFAVHYVKMSSVKGVRIHARLLSSFNPVSQFYESVEARDLFYMCSVYQESGWPDLERVSDVMLMWFKMEWNTELIKVSLN